MLLPDYLFDPTALLEDVYPCSRNLVQSPHSYWAYKKEYPCRLACGAARIAVAYSPEGIDFAKGKRRHTKALATILIVDKNGERLSCAPMKRIVGCNEAHR